MNMLKWRIREIGKQTRNLLWLWAPEFLQNRLLRAHADQAAKQNTKRFLSVNVSENDVADAFKQLQISGDVMVHSSLIHIGNIQGRHKPIVKALQQYVSEQGNTILGIAIPVKGSTEDYLRHINQFDKDAPIAMGIISTYYAKKTDAERSLNPTHSVVAFGPRAKEYTATHHLDNTPFTENSPYYKLLEHNGSIVMIGAAIKHLTLCHIVEDMLGDLYPRRVYGAKSYPIDIYQNGQCIYHGSYKAHSKLMGALRVPQYVQMQIRHLPSTKIVPLGDSELLCIHARDAVICELEELKKGNSIYGYCHINKQCRLTIDHWIETIKNMPNE